ncbi:hypothetical protein RQM65_02785 [Pricia sp. S334]|uniref:Arsenate reductase n=1 Tax=Pricia mediterranea TaxID=3076079 RepID=A0ABU3L1I5_9FLAO|nr:hypothetical protein [Pricia sp. S334]MDT7827590.1 hypothetical protein [Pricia sp. S334]
MKKDERKLSYIYSSQSDLGKKVLAYVESIDKGIVTTDISQDKLGDTIWTEILDALDMTFEELLSTDRPNTREIVPDGDFDTNDWLKILDKNPVLLQHPIAINGDKAKLIQSRADILPFYEVDSAGIEQSPTEGQPDISRRTNGEGFVPDTDENQK